MATTKQLPLGVWYTADGPVELAEAKLDANEARILYNLENTHPAALFSTTAIGVNINFFYGALELLPAQNISSSNQIWPVFVTFLFLAYQLVHSVLGIINYCLIHTLSSVSARVKRSWQ